MSKLIIPTMGLNKREHVYIRFSKIGVDQDWHLFFHSGRLLTDCVGVNGSHSIYLRTVEGCKTLNNVVEFLNTYAFSKLSIKFPNKVKVGNLDVDYYPNRILKTIIELNIKVSKLKGVLYFGQFTITFADNTVSFIKGGIYDYGTYNITGLRDLKRVCDIVIPRLDLLEFAKKLKTIEIL